MASAKKLRKGGSVSHKVIEKRRRDRINHCLAELGNTVPMALARQDSGKLEKAEILEMTVQYLKALHSADLLRGKDKGDLLRELSSSYQAGYQECLRNLVHYLTAVERLELKDSSYLRVLAFLQARARRPCPAGGLLRSTTCHGSPTSAGPTRTEPFPSQGLSCLPMAPQQAFLPHAGQQTVHQPLHLPSSGHRTIMGAPGGPFECPYVTYLGSMPGGMP
uniref:Hairy and enhancer of split-related protein HELT n=1 Tax=Eptatretus burgeri TaxID=7764 RepID=A0A8C4R0C0_EPTBU